MGRVREEKRRKKIKKRREEKKKEYQKRESLRRKKIQVRKKVGKLRNTVFFQWFVAPEGRKVGSLKRRVRSQLARWEMKNCTQLWGEAHFQVKMYKAPQLRSTFRSCDVEKVQAVVARSTFRSQNVQSTPAPDHFWKLRCRKSTRRCGAKHVSKSKCTKHTSSGPLLEVEMSKKYTPLWREAHFEVKMYKAHQLRTTFGSWDVEKVHAVVAQSTFQSQKWKKLWGTERFWTFRCAFAWHAQCTLSKVSNMWGFFVALPKTMAGMGHLTRICKDGFSRGRRSTRDMFIRAVRRSGRWFPETGCILEHQIFRFAEMILRDRCSTSYDLASLFRGGRSGLKIAKRNGTRPSALHSTFHFWGTSRRIASFLMLSPLTNEEVSQNCFVFDAVKFKSWGSLAEIAAFSSLQTDR